MDGWNTTFLLGGAYFQGQTVSFRESIFIEGFLFQQEFSSGPWGSPKTLINHGGFLFVMWLWLNITIHKNESISWAWPPHSNSDQQDYYIFNRESLSSFIYHCYCGGAISNPYPTESDKVHHQKCLKAKDNEFPAEEQIIGPKIKVQLTTVKV